MRYFIEIFWIHKSQNVYDNNFFQRVSVRQIIVGLQYFFFCDNLQLELLGVQVREDDGEFVASLRRTFNLPTFDLYYIRMFLIVIFVIITYHFREYIWYHVGPLHHSITDIAYETTYKRCNCHTNNPMDCKLMWTHI